MKALVWRVGILAAILGLSAGCSKDSDGDKKVTAHGVRYVDLVEGTGEAARLGDGMHYAYTAWLSDGKQFQRREPEHPASSRLGWGQPVLGFDEALEGMKAGGKRKMWIPSRLAYGTRGSPPSVPPNADLIFEVDLIKIVTPEQVKEMGDNIRKITDESERRMIDEIASQNSKPASSIEIAEEKRKEITTPSGLKYTDFAIGDGREAVPGNIVDVLYAGYLTDGTRFDAKLNPSAPHRFLLGAGNVIQGWEEGIKGMKAGGKRKLFIPPSLAYGEKGAGNGKIPPNSTLVFDVELLKVR